MDRLDNPQVFYTATEKSGLSCIDTAHDFGDGVVRSFYKRQTREEMALERGTEILVTDLETFTALKEESCKTEPKRIEEDDFFEALECLPPMRYGHHLGLETFRFTEFLSGRITTIYAREPNGNCWKFNDLASLSHELVRDKISAAAAKAALPA
ncbi:hypothetical protein DAPPUDRAFT_275971 [Daphnia pulex]|uniref:Uncharacterized protein n=1 Tax=Daphnia pulex TaxID=6669 RepID=E9I5M0_DAPPU|nr:hypothetical protein DAPPUDRAFT_275971 [Daphnia pulex]|eukprot:EFX60712.1 hypothetical protein DAPPUDRAFT_275971 [Daphnia pulex]